MRIAVLSDTRYMPSARATAGHGSGRYAAIVAEGLAKHGHDVTLFGAPGSAAAGCQIVTHTITETERADLLLQSQDAYDAYLDCTHLFDFARKTSKPCIARRVDNETAPPPNTVYTTRAHAYITHRSHGGNFDPAKSVVVHDGFDIDSIPFNAGKRGRHVIQVANLDAAAWKRQNLAFEVAARAGRQIWLIGPGAKLPLPCPQPGALPPVRVYKIMAHAAAMLYPNLPGVASGSAAVTECAATGTPVVKLYDYPGYEEAMEPGVCGFAVETPDEMVESLGRLDEIDPAKCRQWVADNRPESKMIDGYLHALQRVVDGEKW